MLIDGTARFQLGLWKKGQKFINFSIKEDDCTRLFHSIKSVSKNGLLALEFETPVDKNDLVRFKDSYGRAQKPYEGKKNFKESKKDLLNIKKVHFEKKKRI